MERDFLLDDAKLAKLVARKAAIMNQNKMAKSAVILPLVRSSEGYQVLFEKRSMDLRHQPGEICFPGGGIEDNDAGPMEAAIRETCEELGLVTTDIEMICPLDIVVSPFNAIIYPFAAFILDADRININSEVEEIIPIPLDYLLHKPPQIHQLLVSIQTTEDFPFHLIPQGHNYPFRKINYPQIFYQYEGTVVWGLTAQILTHFLHLLRIG